MTSASGVYLLAIRSKGGARAANASARGAEVAVKSRGLRPLLWLSNSTVFKESDNEEVFPRISVGMNQVNL